MINECGAAGEGELVGETKYLEKACSIATSSITDHA
jgi:hypothetical protein